MSKEDLKKIVDNEKAMLKGIHLQWMPQSIAKAE